MWSTSTYTAKIWNFLLYLSEAVKHRGEVKTNASLKQIKI